jgi:hypothetical protein
MFYIHSSVFIGPLFESREFQHSGNCDLVVYRVEKEILQEICFVPLGWAEDPRNILSPTVVAMTAVSLPLETLRHFGSVFVIKSLSLRLPASKLGCLQ